MMWSSSGEMQIILIIPGMTEKIFWRLPLLVGWHSISKEKGRFEGSKVMNHLNDSIIKRIAFIGNYLPRQCGIATFTTDLCEAIADEYKGTACIALPVNDTEAGYEYPARVRFELTEKDIESYRRAADFLNINNVDMVSLQHEYGIFGGRAGSYILDTPARIAHACRHNVAYDPAAIPIPTSAGCSRRSFPCRTVWWS